MMLPQVHNMLLLLQGGSAEHPNPTVRSSHHVFGAADIRFMADAVLEHYVHCVPGLVFWVLRAALLPIHTGRWLEVSGVPQI